MALDYELVIDLVEWLNSLWGEPESIEDIIIDNDIVSRKYIASDLEGRQRDGRAEEDELTWDRKNEVILRDSFAISTRRREAVSEYVTYLAEESINSVQSTQNDSDYAYDGNTGATNGEVRNTKNKNKKKQPKLSFGYATKDKCGPYRGEGDDTKHRPIPAYPIPEFVLSTRRDKQGMQDDGHASDARVHLVFYVSLPFRFPLLFLPIFGLTSF